MEMQTPAASAGLAQPKKRRREEVAFRDWLEIQAKQDDEGITSGTEPQGADESRDGSSAITLATTPREYQHELFERAKERNTIVVLDTGSGKTLIAIMLLREVLNQELEDRANGKPPKVAFFVVDKVALCLQQYDVVRTNLPFPVTKFFGDTPSMQEQSYWDQQFATHMIIVCTAQILLDCLDNGFVSMKQISLLIFDEAHHSKKNHPYATIMKQHYPRRGDSKPRILGLTASPVDSQDVNINESVQKLESVMHSQIATVSDAVLEASWKRKDQAEVKRLYSPLKGVEESYTTLTRQIEEYMKHVPQLKRFVLQAVGLGSNLGPWCADRFWQALLTDRKMKKMALSSGKDEGYMFDYDRFEEVADSLESLRPLLSQHNFSLSATDKEAISSKLALLQQVLREAFENDISTKCIVFVKTQFTARILADFFLQPDTAPPCLIADFMVGLGRSATISSLSQSDRLQRLENFRHGDTNCLFATSVAEEGLDIPACDLVIRFDMCDSVIQYIQSRGRARKPSSVYMTLMEESNLHHARIYCHVTQGAKTLKKFCQDLPQDRKIDSYRISSLETELLVAGTATLSKRNSMVVLARFVSTLGQGQNTNLTPEYMVSGTGGNFIGWVILPDAAPFKTATGAIEGSKIGARSAAAYEACVRLINEGCINHNLQPVFKKRVHKMRNARLAINSKKQKEYDVLVKPQAWTNLPAEPPSELFQAVILFNAGDSEYMPIMILTREKIVDLGPIRLFPTTYSSIVTTLEPCQSCSISLQQIQLLSNFTLKVFNEIFSKTFDAKAQELPFYFAPCSTSPYKVGEGNIYYAVDWLALQRITVESETRRANNTEQYFVVDQLDRSRKFITLGINANLHPDDPTPAHVPNHKCRGYHALPNKTIMHYSCTANTSYRLQKEFDTSQAVYDAQFLSFRRDFLHEAGVEDAASQLCYITLQYLHVSSIPVEFVRSAMFLPSILYRIDTALIVSDACRLLGLELPIPLAVEALTNNGAEDESGGDKGEYSPHGNYERLEFLGDTFLKMSTTIALYSGYPTASEFEHHVERMLMVCNKNLRDTALDLELQKYIRTGSFDRRTWFPHLHLVKGKPAKTIIKQSLSDKTIADVCEALIGAAYIGSAVGDMDEAVRAVTRFVNSGNHTMRSFADYYASYTVPDWHFMPSSASVQAAVDRIEATIGYRFNSPLLLRSAFTHPSYVAEDIPNYQTLEFLGDALLDMVVVDFLFRQNPNAGPQWLTEHKMVACGNQFLGCLCVELGLQREILTTDAQVPGQLKFFESRLQYLKNQADAEAADGNGDGASQRYWTLATKPPKLLADVVESLLGAMFVDSRYNFGVIEGFFGKFIRPKLEDSGAFENFGPGHVISKAAHQLQQQFRCSGWQFCVAETPCESRTGMMALKATDCTCGLVVHGEVRWYAKAGSGTEAKSIVATQALAQLRDLSMEAFREGFLCDC